MFFKWFKTIILLIITVFLWVYGPFYFTKQERDSRKKKAEEIKAKSEYLPYINEIYSTFAKEMKEKFKLIPSGYGGIRKRKVEMLSLNFTTERRATVDEARGLQLFLMEQFVKKINAHEKLKSFLIEQPFSKKRINIALDFEEPNGSYYDKSVTSVFNIDGLASNTENRNRIFYMGIDPFKNMPVEIHNETYVEALEILKNSPDLDPFVHVTTPLEIATDQIFNSFVKEMREKHQLRCHSIGGKVQGRVEEVGAKFQLIKHTSKDEAQKLLLALTERLVEKLNQDEEIRPYLIEYPFSTTRIKIRIIFTGSDHFSYDDGSMERITLENNQISYFKVPPEDDLFRAILFYEESYQEAQNSLKKPI